MTFYSHLFIKIAHELLNHSPTSSFSMYFATYQFHLPASFQFLLSQLQALQEIFNALVQGLSETIILCPVSVFQDSTLQGS